MPAKRSSTASANVSTVTIGFEEHRFRRDLHPDLRAASKLEIDLAA